MSDDSPATDARVAERAAEDARLIRDGSWGEVFRVVLRRWREDRPAEFKSTITRVALLVLALYTLMVVVATLAIAGALR